MNTCEPDMELLRYAGIMGHPIAVVCDDGNGGRRLYGECSDLPTARKWALEASGARIYRRMRRGHRAVTWGEVAK